MMDMSLGKIEEKFAELIWENEPLTTRELVALCEKEFGWKRTTTYTVLKKLCNKGLFQMSERTVTSLISAAEYQSQKSELFLEENFGGSLPAFVSTFTSRKKLSEKEIKELKNLIDQMK